VFYLYPQGVSPVPAQGDGTEGNPYLIANLANLRWLSETPSVWGLVGDYVGNIYVPQQKYYFKQTADIDATETIAWVNNLGMGFQPIGIREGNTFYGDYDGDNHVISNLYIYRQFNANNWDDTYIGMFALVQGSTIENVRIENITIISDDFDLDYGGLIANAWDSTIRNCSTSGSIQRNFNAFSADNGVGGLIGFVISSTIENCSSSMSLTSMYGHETLGGLIGTFFASNLRNSYFNGTINRPNPGDPAQTGAIIGMSDGHYVNDISGVVQFIENVYVTGSSPFNNVSGLVGRLANTYIANSFIDSETTGVTAMAGYNVYYNTLLDNYALTSNEMKQALTYTNYRWDFANIWDIDPAINEGYPYLRGEYIDIEPPANLFVTDYIPTIISWEAPISDFPIAYKIYKNNVLLVELPTSELNYIDENAEDERTVYSVTAVYSYGESKPALSIVDVRPSIIEFPWSVDFYSEMVFPADFPPYGWKRTVGQLPSNGDNAKLSFAAANNYKWRYEYMNQCAALDFQSSGIYQWLFTPGLDFRNETGNKILEFKIALDQSGNNFSGDKFIVLMSANGKWSNANIVARWDNDPNTNGNYEYVMNDIPLSWSNISINLGNIRDAVLIAFYGEGASTSTIFLDNVSIRTEPAFNQPLILTATAGDGIVNLNWREPYNDGLGSFIGYKVYRNDYLLTSELWHNTQFSDSDVVNGTTYSYYITAVYTNPDGESAPSNIVQVTPNTVADSDEFVLPFVTSLNGNYPNPFNPTTTIVFTVGNAFMHSENNVGGTDKSVPYNVRIDIYNTKGQKVRGLVDGVFGVGTHKVVWNGLDDKGVSVGSGMYFYRMKAGDYTETKKMILMK
jgi:hypothetical protein